MTDDDYPPLDFALADGSLIGFNVEIARAICEELHIGCTIQARRWDTLIDSLETGKGDAVIASIAISAATRARSTSPSPITRRRRGSSTRKDSPLADTTPTTLAGKTVGVIAGSAHQSFLATFFPAAIGKPYPNFAALHEALRKGAVDAVFADGLTLAVWLAGENSADCCVFKGGPYIESRYFGEGVGIAVRKEDADLRRAMDWALARLAAQGSLRRDLHQVFSGGVLLLGAAARARGLWRSSPPNIIL